MELKNMMHSNSKPLILNRLKEKKNWFLVSFAIMLVTVVILPMVMGDGVEEANIVMGMAEIFFLVYINCMIDFSYLHDSRKLSYNVSKPITDIQRINMAIIVNVVFTAVLVVVLALITPLINGGPDDYVWEMFMVTIPWLLAGIFTAALSSILTGNTIAAGFATVINFTLPLLVLAVINFFFEIIEDIALGFNSSILFSKFIEEVYRIDILYFVKYIDDSFDFTYFLVLAAVLVLLYALIVTMSKRRKHERAGDLVVVDGYKSLISVLVASLAPAVFAQVISYADFTGKIVSFILLSALSFYLINAIMEKSFRIRQHAVKLFIGFVVVFLLFVVGSDMMTEKFESYVPSPVDVSSVYIGQNTWVYSAEKEEGREIYSASEAFVEGADMVLFKTASEIQDITNLHREVIKNQDYYYYSNFVIVYYMKDGEKVYRYYKLDDSEDYKGEKDRFITAVVNGDEFKKRKLNFIYDDVYYDGLDIQSIDVSYQDENYNSRVVPLKAEDVDIDLLRDNMRKDYDDYLSSCGACMDMVVGYRSNDYSLRYNYIPDADYYSGSIKTVDAVSREGFTVNLYLYSNKMDDKGYNNIYIDVNKNMANTFNYLKSFDS
ncbi:hypothetical protein SAMN02745751_00318 [Dethiosulfatibacter aminovorans DSM 17477]|uniref:Uncharacterized protein n=1 Tax=Dethiosulfatibacter aminovorans DSM 17477 TaxID=1121476 RepID=A0A1M6B1D4_9FIRM|nr:hypothetical protein [Dethiosulfatibacter aminovorans]SHI42418.1 hypothetical protein SAMN02745751_00318 [Dethiosulfatibacter aminovorans DSM 17477]